MSLAGKKVLVTGAANGIGRATAIALSQLGADLVITDVEALAATKDQLARVGPRCEAVEGDLTDESFIDDLLSHGPFFALANVAAVFLSKPGQSTRDHFDLVMDVNVYAPMILASRCAVQMAEAGGGHIVLVGSVAGRHGGGSSLNTIDYAAYAASKGGLHVLVKWLSRRAVADNVMVNGVAPGAVRTRLTEGVPFDPAVLPLGRMAEPSELAWPIAMLCTPAASYVSGVILDVNGGSYVA
jgi:3-oxoacyl-[acyl-carrier protein] reductase